MSVCTLCPRQCGTDRAFSYGFCGCDARCRVARTSLHPYEEPCISGTRGSGTIFFSGCNLRCSFCQNRSIQDALAGHAVSAEELANQMLILQDQGAHNINLVTPTPHLDTVCAALIYAKREGLSIPIVYNTGGYETTEAIDRLNGLVDVYLPDFKYWNSTLSARFSGASDYGLRALGAIRRMFEQAGHLATDSDGIAVRGLLIRHLVLPNCTFDSRIILDIIKQEFSSDCWLSVMRQYTPPPWITSAPLNRRLTDREYTGITEYLIQAGFNNVYLQEKDSVGFSYTPDFIRGEGYMRQ